MTLPATQQPKPQLPLRAESVTEALKPLAHLFAAYPEPWADKTASHVKELLEAKANSYQIAVQGIPAWAVQKAVLDFIQGRVERRNRDKLPTAEQLAVVARQHLDEEAKAQQIARRQQEQKAELEREAKFLATRPPAEERARRAAEIMRAAGFHPMPSEE